MGGDAWLLTKHPHALTHGRHRPFGGVNVLERKETIESLDIKQRCW